VRFVLALQVVVSFCVFNFSVYVPLLARNVLGAGSEGFGFLMTALGAGAVLAGLSLGALGSRELPPAGIAVVLGCACACLLGLASARTFWGAAVLLGMTGFAGTLVTGACNTFLQITVSDALRGRVMSLYTLVSSGIVPLGALFVGVVSESWSVSAAFAVNGTLGLVALVCLRPWVARGGGVFQRRDDGGTA
jgi:predicted MFS family arabinose efflux permease